MMPLWVKLMAFCPEHPTEIKSAIFTPKRDDGHLRLLHMRAPAGPVFQSTIILPPVDCLECHFVLSSLDLGERFEIFCTEATITWT